MTETAPAAGPRPNKYARRRAITLISVYVLFAAHMVHWKLAGRTLAPLEVNELMYTLEAGVITAGALLMVLVTLSVAVFGRFFCSWGCHILALEDLCSWLMEKVGIKPRVVRAKALLLVPMGAVLLMFAWPQVQFIFMDRPRPELHMAGDADGWASFVTADYWRNLPPPGIALLTFAVVGFGMVYFMGHRAFCKYGCPYGALFAIFDRIAPGKIRSTGKCDACALCTASCQSDINVHEELATYGKVIDPGCLKDLDCVAACPNGSIEYGFGKPALMRDRSLDAPKPPKAMFNRWEEWGMGLGFIPFLLMYRGLYGQLPLLMSLGLAAVSVYFVVVLLRLVRADAVKLVRAQLKADGKLRSSGWIALVLGVFFLAVVAHSTAIRIQEWRGTRLAEQITRTAADGVELSTIDAGIAACRFVEDYGLLSTPQAQRSHGALLQARGEYLAERGEYEDALSAFEEGVGLVPWHAKLRYNFALMLSILDRQAEAAGHYRVATELAPGDADAWLNLGSLLMQAGEDAEAESCLRRAIELRPDFGTPYFNLGQLLHAIDRKDEAMPLLERAAELDANYAEWLAKSRQELEK